MARQRELSGESRPGDVYREMARAALRASVSGVQMAVVNHFDSGLWKGAVKPRLDVADGWPHDSPS
jgi:hypothetical protein